MNHKLAPFLSALLTLACAESPANLAVIFQGEESITEGVAAGSARGQVADGWSLSFTKYIVAVGSVRVARGTDAPANENATVTVLDTKQVGATGFPLASFRSLLPGQWREVSFALRRATASATRHDSVAQADFDEMVQNGCAYLIEGQIRNPSGTSTPLAGTPRPAPSMGFHFCVNLNVVFGPCANPEGQQGVNVVAGATTTLAFTLHGDHMLFPGFPSEEGQIVRRAQWLANSDGSGDNMITRSELESVQAATLGLPLTGSPIPNLRTGWDYLRAQLATQGHMNGEGECERTVVEE